MAPPAPPVRLTRRSGGCAGTAIEIVWYRIALRYVYVAPSTMPFVDRFDYRAVLSCPGVVPSSDRSVLRFYSECFARPIK